RRPRPVRDPGVSDDADDLRRGRGRPTDERRRGRPRRARNRDRRRDRARGEALVGIACARTRAGAADRRCQHCRKRGAAGCGQAGESRGRPHLHDRRGFERAGPQCVRFPVFGAGQPTGCAGADANRGCDWWPLLPRIGWRPAGAGLSRDRHAGTLGDRPFVAAPRSRVVSVSACAGVAAGLHAAAVGWLAHAPGGVRVSAFELPLHFLRPWWWLALLPLPLALWMLARNGSGRAALAKLADAVLLPHLVSDTGARKRLALGLVALAWLLAVAALSGPAWQKMAAPLYVNGAARVVVLSLSDDMLAQDMQPDRMTRARFAVRDLLNNAGDARMALVAYAGAAFTVAPLTDDKNTILNLLQALKPDVMPVPGNDAASGIRQGVDLLQQAHAKSGEIVLVADTADGAAVAQAKAAHAKGMRVDVLGVGTREGAPVPQAGGGFASGTGGTLMARRDDAALRAVANAGGGRYAVLQADGASAAAFDMPVSQTGHTSRAERAQLWRDGGIWLLPVLLILAALVFRRGWLLVLALLVLPIGMPVARAATWDSLWANRDQRALQALQHGDTARARCH